MENDVKKEFGRRYRQALEASPVASWSDEKIGGAVGLSKQAAYYWRRGTALPRVEIGIELAKLLDVSFEWLMTGRGPMKLIDNDMDSATQLLVVAFGNMPPDARKELLGYASYILERMNDPKERRREDEEVESAARRIVELSRGSKP